MASYVQTSGTLTTNSATYTPIPGLSIALDQGVGVTVIVILNVPNPYATGNDTPGGNFGITVNGQLLPAFASFTYNETVPPSSGRIPTTLVVGIPLAMDTQTVQAVWSGVRGSTVHIDSPATLSVSYS